jgi:AmpE protein
VAQLSDASGIGRVVVALLLPLAICALLQWLFGRSPLGGLLQLGLALVVLIYCLGPRDFEADLEAIIQAPDQPAREAAAQALADDGEVLPWTAPALGSAVAYAALRRRFGVLLWFFLLGPVGALTDIEAGDGYAEEHSDPLFELTRLRSALLRALLAWLSVVALIVIGGWAG